MSDTKDEVAKYKEKRRALAPDHPVGPRTGRKSKRPWLILYKYKGTMWWQKNPKPPRWKVFQRYATEKGRDQSLEGHMRTGSYLQKYYEVRKAKERS